MMTAIYGEENDKKTSRIYPIDLNHCENMKWKINVNRDFNINDFNSFAKYLCGKINKIPVYQKCYFKII